jgi:hypothetical protein
MLPEERRADLQLLDTGVAAAFRVLRTAEIAGEGDAGCTVRVDLKLAEHDDEAAQEAVWAAHGFIFVLAQLSFADARPRAKRDGEFREHDQFTVEDLLDALRFRDGALWFSASEVRGHSMSTDITVRADGSVCIETRERGKAVLRWLDRLQGREPLRLVPTP